MSRQDRHGRIGPNAVIRVFETLNERRDSTVAETVFRRAGLGGYLDALPEAMVPEEEVIALHQALRETLGIAEAREIAREAGRRTGDYLLARRIPRPVQAILKILPPRLASRTLLKAISGNAWTFVGTGQFAVTSDNPPWIEITHSPLCRGARASEPLCDFYAGTFERLFRALVHPHSVVTETACQAMGDPSCLFKASWS
ncbi:MAG: bacteriochlorophyll 4-vinyl reductase [Thermochromatium sp.]